MTWTTTMASPAATKEKKNDGDDVSDNGRTQMVRMRMRKCELFPNEANIYARCAELK